MTLCMDYGHRLVQKRIDSSNTRRDMSIMIFIVHSEVNVKFLKNQGQRSLFTKTRKCIGTFLPSYILDCLKVT